MGTFLSPVGTPKGETMSFLKNILRENDRSHLQPYGEQITIAWTADASGNYTEVIENMKGWIVLMLTRPGGVAPTSYGITLLPTVGYTSLDMLSGVGAGRSATNQERIPDAGNGISLITYVNGDYTFSVSSAGNGGQGVCDFFIKNR